MSVTPTRLITLCRHVTQRATVCCFRKHPTCQSSPRHLKPTLLVVEARALARVTLGIDGEVFEAHCLHAGAHQTTTLVMSTGCDMRSAAKLFFSSTSFAVAGASSDTAKFGHKIFAWYLNHGLPAIPMNPTCSSVTVRGEEYETVASPSKLPEPKQTSLSVITPPPVTAQLLKEAKEAGVRAVWLQPGSFTDKELDYATKEFPGAAVGGFAEGTRGGEGWCVLVDGEAAMSAAGNSGKL